MTKIGLYGDSFTGEVVSSNSGITYHWSTLLADSIGGELTNFGRAGSSIYYSYRNFLENYNKFDLNIFVISMPDRYIKPITLNQGDIAFIPNIDTLEYFAKTNQLSEKEKTHLVGWFISSDEVYHTDMTDLMIDKIVELDPSVVLIPGFKDALSSGLSRKLGNAIDLIELQQKQALDYNANLPNLIAHYEENLDIISGHFTPEYNEYLFKVIKTRIDTGIWNNIPMPKMEFKYSFNEVFIKR